MNIRVHAPNSFYMVDIGIVQSVYPYGPKYFLSPY
jgi:hypothetical protein